MKFSVFLMLFIGCDARLRGATDVDKARRLLSRRQLFFGPSKWQQDHKKSLKDGKNYWKKATDGVRKFEKKECIPVFENLEKQEKEAKNAIEALKKQKKEVCNAANDLGKQIDKAEDEYKTLVDTSNKVRANIRQVQAAKDKTIKDLQKKIADFFTKTVKKKKKVKDVQKEIAKTEAFVAKWKQAIQQTEQKATKIMNQQSAALKQLDDNRAYITKFVSESKQQLKDLKSACESAISKQIDDIEDAIDKMDDAKDDLVDNCWKAVEKVVGECCAWAPPGLSSKQNGYSQKDWQKWAN